MVKWKNWFKSPIQVIFNDIVALNRQYMRPLRAAHDVFVGRHDENEKEEWDS